MLTLNVATQAADVDGQRIELTRRQFGMLLLLVQRRRASWRDLYANYRALAPHVQNGEINMGTNVRSNVTRIRKRLRAAAPDYWPIKVISGFGYSFEGDARVIEEAPENGPGDERVRMVMRQLGRGRIWRILSPAEMKLLLGELLRRRAEAASAATGAGATSSSAAGGTPAGAQGDPSGSRSPRINSLPPTSGASAVCKSLGS